MFESRWRTALSAAALTAVAALAAAGWWRWRYLQRNPFLDGKRKKLRLLKKQRESHDTLRLVFALEDVNQTLGAFPGTHIVFYGPNRKGEVDGLWNNKPDVEAPLAEIRRKFTPISPLDEKGEVEILLKVYSPKKGAYDDGGKFSQYLAGIEIGDYVTVSGPVEKVRYCGPGTFQIARRRLEKKKVGLLAGGSGIAPPFQIIRAVLNNPSDETKLYLIFANKTEADILLRKELEEFATAHPDRFHLWYTLDSAPAKWRYSVGYINAEMIREHIPPPAEDVIVFCCGPKPMVQDACKANLSALGYNADDIATF